MNRLKSSSEGITTAYKLQHHMAMRKQVHSSVGSIPPPPQGFRVHQKQSLMAIPTGVAGGFGNSLAKHRTFAVDVSPDM